MLEVENLTVRYGSLTIVDGLSFSVDKGQWLMIVGPNGAGKSTVLGAVTQGVPYTGTVRFEGKDAAACKPGELARCMGVVTQSRYVGYSFTVGEVVRLGRYAYSKGFFSSGSDEDSEKVNAALKATGMLPFKNQSVLTLSGGELQRTFLAQALAQDPRLLILDEPANHLDLVYQKQVFGLIREWLLQSGRAVISVAHDLSLAKAYGTHAILLDGGKAAAMGETGEVLTRQALSKVYGMDVYAWMQSMLEQWKE